MLGTADLALGITIIAGRSSRWRWRAVAARALLHLLFAREYARNNRRRHAVAMCALFVIDAGPSSIDIRCITCLRLHG